MPKIKSENILKIIPVHLFMNFFSSLILISFLSWCDIPSSLILFIPPGLSQIYCHSYFSFIYLWLCALSSFFANFGYEACLLSRFSPTNCLFLIFVFVNCIFFSYTVLLTFLRFKMIFFCLYWLHSWNYRTLRLTYF